MLLLGVITIFPQSFLKAQPEDPNISELSGGPGDPGGDPDAVPLDPGSWILAAAGVGYGVKKWRDAQQNSRKDIYRINDIGSKNEVHD